MTHLWAPLWLRAANFIPQGNNSTRSRLPNTPRVSSAVRGGRTRDAAAAYFRTSCPSPGYSPASSISSVAAEASFLRTDAEAGNFHDLATAQKDFVNLDLLEVAT